MTKDKMKIFLGVVVVVLLLVLIGLLVVKPIIEKRDGKIYNQGIRFAIGAVMQEVSSCDIIPLTYDNQTIEIIAIECLSGDTEE